MTRRRPARHGPDAKTYGHVIAELEDAPTISAKAAIAAGTTADRSRIGGNKLR